MTFDLLSDLYLFWSVEFLLLCLVFVGFLKDNFSSGFITVKRGPESWSYFSIAFAILSLIVSQIVAVANVKYIENHKVLISIIDSLALIYLCYFNGWFRNRIVGGVGKARGKTEKLV